MEHRLTGMGFSLALLFGVFGMGVWGALEFSLQAHFSPIAWIMGGLISGGMIVGKSRGFLATSVAILILVVAVAGGMLMAAQIDIRRETVSMLEEDLTVEAYEDERSAASDLSKARAQGEVDMVTFIEQHSYTMQDGADAESARVYSTYVLPRLEKMAKDDMSYDTWKEEAASDMELLIRTEFTLGKILLLSIDVLDIVFITLGIGTCVSLLRPE